MKIRTQRVHHMGSSNRDNNTSFHEPKNVFETSYIKSQSSYYKTAQSLRSQSDVKDFKTSNPFQGTHIEMETKRWNSKAKRIGVETQWKLQSPIPKLDYSYRLNKEISEIASEFGGKEINIFKLNELKKTFIKNNNTKRNLSNYFQNYASEGRIGTEELKRIVKQYGYDINEDEAKLIFRLTSGRADGLAINDFIELMTKDNVYFRTLKLQAKANGRRQNFDEKMHLVLRNKFSQLKEAFRIYRMRGEEVDEDKFNYVMKKLDINDLVVTKAQRKQLFFKFKDQKGYFNVQRLLCSIAEQENIEQPSILHKKQDFQDNLNVKEENEAKLNQKPTYFDFRRTSNLQYQKQFSKAQMVLRQLKKLNSQSRDLVANNGGSLSKQQLRKKVQNLLQSHGINFNKYDYDCFASYLEYNNSNKIGGEDFKRLIDQPPQKAQERFDRRIRILHPQGSKSQDYDQNIALDSLQKVKGKKYDTQIRTLFQQFDKDKDGYVSKNQLKDRLDQLAVLKDWEIHNLLNYFDPSGKGYVNYSQFADKYTNSQKQIQDSINEPLNKLKSQSDWIYNKRSVIKETNSYTYNIPSKYSAWPERLKRTDFSLIQPPTKAGQYASEDQRFNLSEKHNLGQQAKQQKHRIYENRLRRLAAWNDINQERLQSKAIIEQQRIQANDYSMRLAKQAYQSHCHNN